MRGSPKTSTSSSSGHVWVRMRLKNAYEKNPSECMQLVWPDIRVIMSALYEIHSVGSVGTITDKTKRPTEHHPSLHCAK